MFKSIDLRVKLHRAECQQHQLPTVWLWAGYLLTSLCLFLFICKMVLVIVCGHLLGLSWSSQEACMLNPLCGVLHHQVQSQCKVTFAVCISFSLASGQRPMGGPKEGLFTIQDYFLLEGRLGLHFLWEASPTFKSPQWELPSLSLFLAAGFAT